MDYPILSYLIFFPLVGVVLLLFLGREQEKLLKGITLVVTLVEFFLSLPLD